MLFPRKSVDFDVFHKIYRENGSIQNCLLFNTLIHILYEFMRVVLLVFFITSCCVCKSHECEATDWMPLKIKHKEHWVVYLHWKLWSFKDKIKLIPPKFCPWFNPIRWKNSPPSFSFFNCLRSPSSIWHDPYISDGLNGFLSDKIPPTLLVPHSLSLQLSPWLDPSPLN